MTINYSATVQFSEEDSRIVNDFFQWMDRLCLKVGSDCRCCPLRSSDDNGNTFCRFGDIESTMKENGILLVDYNYTQADNYSLKDCTISQNK